LCWVHSPFREYSPKKRYKYIIDGKILRELVWWWRKLWKLSCVAKVGLFLWCILENKVPTSDNLKREIWQGQDGVSFEKCWGDCGSPFPLFPLLLG